MPYRQLSEYFNSFYQAHNNEELSQFLDEVIINNNDYKFENRKKLLEKTNFSKENAAQNILKDLDCVFKEAV